MTETEIWWKGAWRPAAAGIYLSICLFDFVVMPMINSNNYDPAELVDQALRFNDPTVQVKALAAMDQGRMWEPLTTQGNGIFHLSFGAILGAAAHGRSKEKVARSSKDIVIGENPA